MILTIESTNQITNIDGVDARVWKGKTEKGVECILFVHRIAAKTEDDQTEFQAELAEMNRKAEAVDLRYIL